MKYGWIEDPEPLEWPDELRFQRGEVVRITDVEALAGRSAVVVGFDTYGDGGAYRYVVDVEGEEVSWVIEEADLDSTGKFNPERLPKRIRPVIGDGTAVRLVDTAEARDFGIVGALALTEGLWWSGNSEEPSGYSVRLPGQRRIYSLPFEGFELIPGCLPSSSK